MYSHEPTCIHVFIYPHTCYSHATMEHPYATEIGVMMMLID